jgi:Catalase/haloacid dehalogenase-like hydrolase
MSRAVRAALFDVDGTLVDTNYLHAVTWWEAFAQARYQLPMADIHRAIGMGSDQMLDKLLPPDRDKDADADVRAAHSTLYATYWSRLRPLPGAADLLRACKRVVHARGYGAHGYFENYEPLTDITRADPFSEAGLRTPVFVRFSTVAGNKGSSDLARDVRGFATKFYTREGNWDLVGSWRPRSAAWRPATASGCRPARGSTAVPRCCTASRVRRPAGARCGPWPTPTRGSTPGAWTSSSPVPGIRPSNSKSSGSAPRAASSVSLDRPLGGVELDLDATGPELVQCVRPGLTGPVGSGRCLWAPWRALGSALSRHAAPRLAATPAWRLTLPAGPDPNRRQ